MAGHEEGGECFGGGGSGCGYDTADFVAGGGKFVFVAEVF